MLKERYLWIGLFIVICSMVGNELYFQSKKLTEPIFLQHYYETFVYEGNQLQFFYLSDKAEPAEVSYVTVDDVKMNPIEVPFPSFWSKEVYRPDITEEFTHHILQSVTLQLPTDSIPVNEGSDDIWTFKNMEVTFTNGKTIEANIGEVRVYGKLKADDALKNTYDSSSNRNFNEWYAVATEPLTIDGISIPFSEQVGTDLYIKLFFDPKITTQGDIDTYSKIPDWYNEEFLSDMLLDDLDGISLNDELFPIHLNESDYMKLYMYFSPESKFAFDFNITIYGSTDNGEPFEYAVPINSSNRPSLTEEDVNKIIEKQRGGMNQ